MSNLTNLAMPDGTMCFYTPEIALNPHRLRQLIGYVQNVKLIGSIDCNDEGGCWFEFNLIEKKCKVNNPFNNGTYWFITEDPKHEKEFLEAFVMGLESLLDE